MCGEKKYNFDATKYSGNHAVSSNKQESYML